MSASATQGGHNKRAHTPDILAYTLFVSAKMFCCSFTEAKKAFYRASNAIFGKISRIASENVIVELLKNICIPVL